MMIPMIYSLTAKFSRPITRKSAIPSGVLISRLIIMLSAAVLCIGLIVGHSLIFGSASPVVDQVRSATQLVQTIHAAQLRSVQFSFSGDPADLVAAEQAMTALDQVPQSLLAAPSVRQTVQELSELQSQELNALRGLNVLWNTPGADVSREALRHSIQTSGQALYQTAADLLDERIGALRQTLDGQSALYAYLQFSIFGSILLILAAVLLHSFRHSQRTLDSLNAILGAANNFTRGDFSAKVDVERPDEPFARLAVAFNQMADSLKNAIHTEAAANAQNHQQLLKLARQERMTAILEERQRIGRELHDSVKQQLFSITLAAGAALNLLDHEPNAARIYLEHVKQTGHSAMAEMTSLLQEMWPLALQDQHLEEALLRYLTPLCEVHQIKLHWRVEGASSLSIAQEHALFRVVQEGVGNVIRHSQATRLRISLRFGLRTWLIIEDNGRGFDPQSISSTSRGLSMMRMRLEQVGGSLTIPTNTTGTRLEIVMDLPRGSS